jgi:hypothetical protein
LLRGYDDLGHAGYILYLDLYHSVPWADQGWSYFHPPLHYMVGGVLAQFDSPVVLLRGLAVLGSAASLAIAVMAARVTRLVCPSRDDLALLAFVAVGLLPVYLYTSTMAGNELTAAFFGTVGLTVLIANECRKRPGLGRDALAGLAIGIALLTKVSAVLVLAVAGATLGLRALRERPLAASLRRNTLRGLVLACVAVAIASPYYARNVREFGTPFKMSRDNPDVARLESSQEPGSRTWVDFVALPPKLLLDPDPRKEHLLHSVWGSAYAQMWADSRASWDHLGERHEPHIRRARSLMTILGLAPTLLALLGGVLGFLDVLRGRRAPVYVPLFASAAVSLGSFAYFAVAAPQFSALKASYLLGLTLPYAVFLARAVEALGRIAWRGGAILGATLVTLPSLAAAFVYADGVVLPTLGNAKAMSALLFYFGDQDGHEAARRFYEHHRDSPRRRMWTDNLGAVALVEGDPVRARSLFGLHPPKPGRECFRWNAYGVATALSGARERAVEILSGTRVAGRPRCSRVGPARRTRPERTAGTGLARSRGGSRAKRANRRGHGRPGERRACGERGTARPPLRNTQRPGAAPVRQARLALDAVARRRGSPPGPRAIPGRRPGAGPEAGVRGLPPGDLRRPGREHGGDAEGVRGARTRGHAHHQP